MSRDSLPGGLLGFSHLVGGKVLQLIIGNSAWGDSNIIIDESKTGNESDNFRLGHLRSGIGGILVGIAPCVVLIPVLLLLGEDEDTILFALLGIPILSGIIFALQALRKRFWYI